MLNLKIRMKQKWFWITLIPLVFLFLKQTVGLIQAFQMYAITEALTNGAVETIIIELIGIAFTILALVGFPVDLTTDGYGDSVRALGYTEPAPNASETALMNNECTTEFIKEKIEETIKVGGTCDD